MDTLLRLFKHQNPRIRRHAVETLSQMNDPKILKTFVDMAYSDNRFEKQLGIWGLGYLKRSQASTVLIRLLRTSNGVFRKEIIRSLGSMKSRSSIKYLAHFLKNEDYTVRRLATWALGNTGDFNAMNPIIEALTDSDSGVRANAAAALRHFEVQKIYYLLKSAMKDKNWYVRLNAMTSLSELDGKIKNIKTMDGDFVGLTYDREPIIRQTAIRIIGKKKYRSAAFSLIRLLDDKNFDVRKETVITLGLLRVPKTKQALLDYYHRADPQLRPDIANSLRNLGSSEEELSKNKIYD